jgi:DNA replication and repair protein RecF
LTVIQGANGQGKSNLLEAVFLLSIAKSPRASSDRSLIGWDVARTGGHAQISGYARDAEATVHAQIDFEVDAASGDSGSVRKSLRVNGVVRSAAEFVGAINVVEFAAEDIDLIAGPPSERRKYLDILISQTDSAYLRTLQRFGRVVTQRNHLLRLVRERRANEDELDFWDGRLAAEGAAIVDRRRRAVERLLAYAAPAHQDLAGIGNQLGIEYLPRLGDEVGPAPSGTLREIAEQIARSVKALRGRELAHGVTVVGPHRDDLLLNLNGKPAGAFASRGQARTIALALRLAEAEFVEEAAGRKPVLALDDVLSELDSDRRTRVLLASQRYDQVLLTTTDFSFVPPEFLGQARRMSVRAGLVGSASDAAG